MKQPQPHIGFKLPTEEAEKLNALASSKGYPSAGLFMKAITLSVLKGEKSIPKQVTLDERVTDLEKQIQSQREDMEYLVGMVCQLAGNAYGQNLEGLKKAGRTFLMSRKG